jgi:UMF1 family MFS transporter
MNTSTNPLSLAGTPAASPLGYLSWTSVQAARDPLYIMVIIYIFFPYFSNEVVGDPIKGQTLIGYLNASAGLAMALTVPFMGAIADKIGRRKPWIVASHLVLSATAISLWWVHPTGIGIARAFVLLFFMIVAFGYSEVFHNAMLPSVAPRHLTGMISGLAFSLGNMAAIGWLLLVLFAFALPGTMDWDFLPDAPLFGVDQAAHEHDRMVGPIGGIWLLFATLPLLFFTPDGESSSRSIMQDVKLGLLDVLATARQIRHYSNIGLYLLARMFFNDGMVGVLVFNGVYASGVFGWDSNSLLILGVATSASAMIGAYLGGLLDDRLGSISTLKVAIGMTTVILLLLVSISPGSVLFVLDVSTEPLWSAPFYNTIAEFTYIVTFQFFALFFVTGLSASRTLMAKLSPPEMATQFFGLYSLSGTVTAFLAPLMVGLSTAAFQSQRAGFGALVVLMVIGATILFWVKEEQATVAPTRA